MEYGNKKQNIFLELNSDPHVVTATVSALGLSLHGLWSNTLKVHKNDNFLGFDFEFFTISMLVMHNQ